MSTKIYNAYELKAPSTHKLSGFVKNVKKIYTEKKVFPEINRLMFNKVEYFTQYLTIHNNLDNKNIAENVIKYAANYMFPKNRTTPSDFTLTEAMDKLENTSVLSTVYNVIETEMKIAENDKSIMTANYDFSSSIALFTYRKRQFIMVFGRYLASLFDDIVNSNDPYYEAFRNEYELRDYHYQNQTDQPDEITDEDWNERRHTWDVLLPSGIPSKDGIIIKIIDTEDIISDMWRLRFEQKTCDEQIKNILSNKLSADMTIDKYAVDLVKDKAYTEYRSKINDDDAHMVSNYMRFSRQFDKDLREANGDLLKQISYCKERLKPLAFDFDDQIEHDIRTKSIIEFLNEHSDENHKIERNTKE